MGLRFPLFIELANRPVVVVGGGMVGLRRAAVLREFGAKVTVISPVMSGELEGIVHIPRPYRAGDLENAFLAVAATDSREVNHAVWAEAQERGILVSVSDCPEECSFFFPAICRTETLVAGVVGDGSDHKKTSAAAKKLREALEELE